MQSRKSSFGVVKTKYPLFFNTLRASQKTVSKSFPFKYGAERFYRKDKVYDLLINIMYNQKPIIKKKGSAIFLHLTNKKYKPTKGCIAILKKDFLKILPFISKNTKICIN